MNHSRMKTIKSFTSGVFLMTLFSNAFGVTQTSKTQNLNNYIISQGESTPNSINTNSNTQLVAKANASSVLPKKMNTITVIPPDRQITQINMNNLNNVDGSADELLKLKRKVELEKANAELKKLQSPPIINGKVSNGSLDNAQTTVTGVAINQQGEKIAWLQFADGGSLTVNIGSKVGEYTVSDISMTGVTLHTVSKKRAKGNTIFLKRAYYAPEKSQQNNQRGNSLFAPSPIITNANTGNENDMVPPIVTVR